MDLLNKVIILSIIFQNKLSDGHGNIVFEPLGHRQKYGNDGFCVNKQTPEPQLILLQTSI